MNRTECIECDVDWKTHYADMIYSAKDAVSEIRPGHRVFVGTGCAQPQVLAKALAERAGALSDIEIVHLLTMGEAPYAEEALSQNFRVNSFFIADNVRHIIQEGLGDYTPVPLFDIPKLFRSGQLPLDVALIQVAPPDVHGVCSLGISVDIVKAAAENASLVIAQVNEQMPRTMGDSGLNVHEFDMLVPTDLPLLEVHAPQPDPVSSKIGENIASLVEDESTLELGLGDIPIAVLSHLKDKKDLGIHTEMFFDPLIDLIESGVITGKRKSADQGKIVASFCMGTKRLYDYVDDNPAFAFYPTEYVNDPYVIGKQDKMVAVSEALEVDLTGQVCADSKGTRFFSGIGGKSNFNQGAGRSAGGKAIVALRSTDEEGKVSSLVAQLSPGAGVVTTRGDVHYVVTEYGVAYLHGKSIQERTLALISIAHPDHRAELLKDAIEAKYIHSELADREGRIHLGPPELRTAMLLRDGTQVQFRPIHPTDHTRMKDLFYALSSDSVYSRWMSHLKRVPAEEIKEYVYIDHRSQVAIVGTLPEAHGDDIIAVGGYYLHPKINRAEVAFTVRDDWQNRGIGSFLLKSLIRIARRNGIAGFTAEVLRQNKAMQSVFNKADCKVQSHLEEGVYSFDMDFV